MPRLRMLPLVAAALCAFAATAKGADPVPAEAAADNSTVWGQVARPLQLGWRISPRKTGYAPGDIVEVLLSVRNAGATAIDVASPRTEVLEKHGLDIELRGALGSKRAWSWGPALYRDEHLTVSGATVGSIPAGGVLELPTFTMQIGGDKSKLAESIGVYLEARPGEESCIYFSIDSIGIARGDEALLASRGFEFRVEE